MIDDIIRENDDSIRWVPKLDFMVCFKRHNCDKYVSLIACTERAEKWCIANADDLSDIYIYEGGDYGAGIGEIICEGMNDNDAEKLRERLKALGFEVIGVS